MLPGIISGGIKIGKYIVNESFWMISNSRCKMYGIKESEISESKKSFVGWWSL